MKNIKGFSIIFISGSLLILLIFLICMIINAMPNKENYDFPNIIESASVIKNSTIDNKSGRVSIYFDTDSSIFKAYDYHSYISGDGYGEKIYLNTYLVSEEDNMCYKIKTYCYDYSDSQNLKFIVSYYDKFIDTSKRYKLGIYVIDTEIFYITDIEI